MLEQENNTQEQQNVDTENKTYTEAEFQSEVDKRVTQALATQQRKNEAKIKEAEKLAKMNSDEKYLYELEQREKAIAEKEKQLAIAENRNEASKILVEKGISLNLVDFVLAEDADTMHDNIKKLDKAFKDSVKQEVEKRLSGKPPVASKDPSTMSGAEFGKLSLDEKQRIYNTDRNLFNELSSK